VYRASNWHSAIIFCTSNDRYNESPSTRTAATAVSRDFLHNTSEHKIWEKNEARTRTENKSPVGRSAKIHSWSWRVSPLSYRVVNADFASIDFSAGCHFFSLQSIRARHHCLLTISAGVVQRKRNDYFWSCYTFDMGRATQRVTNPCYRLWSFRTMADKDRKCSGFHWHKDILIKYGHAYCMASDPGISHNERYDAENWTFWSDHCNYISEWDQWLKTCSWFNTTLYDSTVGRSMVL